MIIHPDRDLLAFCKIIPHHLVIDDTLMGSGKAMHHLDNGSHFIYLLGREGPGGFFVRTPDRCRLNVPLR